MRLSTKKLRGFRSDYLAHFQGWTAIDSAAFYRLQDVILQFITLEDLSFGEYRPVSFIQNLAMPQDTIGQAELLQDLRKRSGAPGLSVSERDHPRLVESIARRLQEEIYPRPLEPIDLRALQVEYARRAVPTIHEAVSLACLSARLHERAAVNYWIGRSETMIDERKQHGLDTSLSKVEFVRKLREAQDRDLDLILQATLAENREKFGI